MKKIAILISLLTSGLIGFSQINFEKGYFINNGGQRTECLIKNVDWNNNPVNFLYKLSEDSQPVKAILDSVKEFGINDQSKYIRAIVDIDRSSELVEGLSSARNPEFNKEKLFLKVLVEGKADLYSYRDVNLVRYFYKMDTAGIEQLIFKSFRTPNAKVGVNNSFRQQLWVNLKCAEISNIEIENIDYNKNELIKLFEKYNNCDASESVNFEPKEKTDLFNLNIRPGVCFSILSTGNSISTSRNVDFKFKPAYRLGVENEFVMPFLKNKWSVIIEPGIQVFNASEEITNNRVKVNYKSLELPVGLRHYFFLNDEARIFINGSLDINFGIRSNISFANGYKFEIETPTIGNLIFGAGFKYKSNYNVELRYCFNRNILTNYAFWFADYTSLSLIFGYTIF